MVPGITQLAELRTFWVTKSLQTLKTKPLKQTSWKDVSQKTSKKCAERMLTVQWWSAEHGDQTGPMPFIFPRLPCLPQRSSLTPAWPCRGHTPCQGSALPPTKGRVTSRHMPQIKQHQATFRKQLVNINVVWICDGHRDRKVLSSLELPLLETPREPAWGRKLCCKGMCEHTHEQAHTHTYTPHN